MLILHVVQENGGFREVQSTFQASELPAKVSLLHMEGERPVFPKGLLALLTLPRRDVVHLAHVV